MFFLLSNKQTNKQLSKKSHISFKTCNFEGQHFRALRPFLDTNTTWVAAAFFMATQCQNAVGPGR